MSWAVDIKTDNAGQKLVLLMLSNYCNKHTGQCNPSHKRLAEECSMSVSSLKNHILWLSEKGYLQIIPKFQDGVNLPNQYLLNIGGVGQPLAGGRSTVDPGVGQPLTTNLEVKPRIEPEKKSSRKKEEISLSEFLDECVLKDERPIKNYRPLWEYQESAGIPFDFVVLAWHEFCRKINDSEKTKKYKDWRRAFKNYIENNYLKLWAITQEGEYFLTNEGKQAEIFHNKDSQ